MTSLSSISLTKPQLEAINHENGNLQIIACAGSGKTEVVSGKVAKLIAKGHSPESIIAFTFTEKAAAELTNRIRKSVEREMNGQISLGNMYVGTIHGFCFNLVKEFDPKYQNFDPLDERTRVSFLATTSTYKHLKLDKLGVMGKYNTIKQFCQSVDALREEEITSKDLSDSSFSESMSRYEQYIEQKKVIDFTSMLYLAVTMLQSDKKLLKEVRKKYKFVIVDEYQDVNKIQEKLVNLICGSNGNLTVVGDDDQAIYQWRGTDVKNMIEFDKRYAAVKPVKLLANYRSTKDIVSNANRLIQHNVPERLPKVMKAENKNMKAEKGDCYLLHFDTIQDEADWIVKKIKSMLGTKFVDKDGTERPLDLGDFAILLRSVRKPSEVLIPKLRAADLDFYIKGTAGLFARPEVILVMQCLSYVSGFEFGDNRTRPPSLTELQDLYLQAFPKRKHRVKTFLRKIKQVKKGSWDDHKFHHSILQIVYQHILNAIGLEDEKFSELQMHQLGKFSTVLTDFETYNSMTKMKYMKYFFGFATGYAKNTYGEGGEEEDLVDEAITVSTIHGAKGLEFPVVFMPYLIDKFFPTTQIGKHTKWLFDSNILSDPTRYDSNETDERRLFYVGITRAKKFLFLSHATRVHTQRPGTPSRFLSELNRSVMITRNIKDPTKRRKMTKSYVKPLNIFPTNYSHLRYYMACPYDYKMRHVYQFNPIMKSEMGYGKQVHNCLNLIHQTFRETGKMDVKTAMKIADDTIFFRYAGGQMLENLTKGVKRAATSYVKKYGHEMKHILESEKPFEFAIDEILISGKIDLIKRADEDEPDTIEVIDFKNEKQKVRGEVPFDTKMQLTLYAIASKESLGYNPKKAFVHNLDDNTRSEVELNDAVMSESKDRVRQIVGDIRNKNFPMAPDIGRKCKDCDWESICTKQIIA